MFKIDPAPTFPAEVSIPMPDGGTQKLPLVFKHMRTSQLDTFLKAAKGRTESQMIEALVDAVPGLPDGKTVETYLLEIFDAYPSAAPALFQEWLRCLTEGRRKN